MKAFSDRWGEEAWEVAAGAFEGYGQERAQRLIKRLNIDIHDARSIGRIMDFEDNGMGIKGEWVEYGKKRAVKRELYCPLARWLTNCPEVCTRLMGGMSQGTFEAMGIRLKPHGMPKLLSKGDPYCEAIIELAD